MYYTLEELRPRENYSAMDSDSFVTCDVKGGLGNQMFMIFATLSYAKKYGRKAWFLQKSDYGDRPSYWTSFFSNLKTYLSIHPITSTYQEPFFEYREIPNGYDQLIGYFQSEKYFKDHYDSIYRELGIQDHQIRIRREWNMTGNTASLHLRIGDYVNLQNSHPIQTYDYYQKAMTELSKKGNMTMYCFFEKKDLEKAKRILEPLQKEFSHTFVWVPLQKELTDWEEMVLMSCCEHHIIANSSFSWWGAYLNPSKTKTVYYPTNWFGPSLHTINTKDICPDEWHPI